jgi:hypothetical protein
MTGAATVHWLSGAHVLAFKVLLMVRSYSSAAAELIEQAVIAL